MSGLHIDFKTRNKIARIFFIFILPYFSLLILRIYNNFQLHVYPWIGRKVSGGGGWLWIKCSELVQTFFFRLKFCTWTKSNKKTLLNLLSLKVFFREFQIFIMRKCIISEANAICLCSQYLRSDLCLFSLGLFNAHGEKDLILIIIRISNTWIKLIILGSQSLSDL